LLLLQRSNQGFDKDPELKERLDEHHRILLSSFFAQPEALMNGKNIQEVMKD